MASKVKAVNKIVFIEGVCNQSASWNGYYWGNKIGNDILNINRQLKSQGFMIVPIREIQPRKKEKC